MRHEVVSGIIGIIIKVIFNIPNLAFGRLDSHPLIVQSQAAWLSLQSLLLGQIEIPDLSSASDCHGSRYDFIISKDTLAAKMQHTIIALTKFDYSNRLD